MLYNNKKFASGKFGGNIMAVLENYFIILKKSVRFPMAQGTQNRSVIIWYSSQRIVD